MATGDIKYFTISQNGFVLSVEAIDLGNGDTQFNITSLAGKGDLNAIWWSDNDSIVDGTVTLSKSDNSLNMNGTGVVWDGYEYVSSTGLGKAGETKTTFITQGETLSFTADVNLSDVTVLGIREYLLPSPASVIAAMTSSQIDWTGHILVTGAAIFGAFVIAAVGGIALGTIIAWSSVMNRALMPFLVFVNTLPKVAVAPLFLLWLGYGILPNMLIGALIGFFPVVINTAVGLSQIDDDMLDLGRVFNAPKWKVFAKIRIPNAYPYILSALKVTATSAVVGAIVGEFVASQSGLGYVIITSQSSMNTPLAFGALVWISILGLVLYGAVAAMSRVLAPWAEGQEG